MYNEGIHRKEGIVMKQELMDAITEKTKELMNSVTCCAEARAAAQTWLDAVGTQRIEEVKMCIRDRSESGTSCSSVLKEIESTCFLCSRTLTCAHKSPIFMGFFVVCMSVCA